MHIEIFPSPLPDETVYSLGGRILVLNGIQNDAANQILFDSENQTRLADGKIDIARFTNITRGHYGDAAEAAAALTNVKFFQRFGAIENDSTLANLSNGEPHIWRWCPSCLTEDQGRFGSPYWHRAHQLPGVFTCARHGMALTEANIPFRERQNHILLPGYLPSGTRLTTYTLNHAGSTLANQLADFAEQAMQDHSTAYSWPIVRQAILDGLFKIGLCTTKQRLRRDSIALEFQTFYLPLCAIPDISNATRKKSIEEICRELSEGQKAITQPRNTLLLAFWLFRNWNNFRNACTWSDAIGSASTGSHTHHEHGSPDEPRPQYATLQHLHREICMAFLQQHPYASRSNLWRTHPKACRWLNRHDAEWFSDIFPSDIRRGASQLKLL